MMPMALRRALRCAVLSVLAASQMLAGSGRAAQASEEAARGRVLAERLCVTCHLNPGQGEKRGARGIPGFRAVAKRPGQSLHGIVGWLKGIPPMMPNHKLTQDEMFQLAAYILSLADEE